MPAKRQSKRRVVADLIPLPPLDVRSPISLHQQLYTKLRESIVSGAMKPGTRLPSTRALCEQINLSRNTVVNAYLQLWSEGYLAGRKGSGTFVADELPETRHRPEKIEKSEASQSLTPKHLSARGRNIAALPKLEGAMSPLLESSMTFRLGVPALDAFPFELWSRLLTARWKHVTREMMRAAPPAGVPLLRKAIADYLTTARGVNCSADQVLVVSGSQQAQTLAAQVLLDPGDAVWIEDPGYPAARGALLSAGARLIPVPVDSGGIDVNAALRAEPKALLASVTPAYQFPTGVTMSPERRRMLLDWARDNNSWIIEDDYDSEFRYRGSPPVALQGMRGGERVIYSGSFSKVLLPSLRLGYLVVPANLVPAFERAKLFNDIACPTVDQLVLADFLNEGHFARHVRRMRRIYGTRQDLFVELAAKELKGLLDLPPTHAGMHILGKLLGRHASRDVAVSKEAADAAIHALPLSACRVTSRGPGGLVLGFAGATERELREGVQKLKRILLKNE